MSELKRVHPSTRTLACTAAVLAVVLGAALTPAAASASFADPVEWDGMRLDSGGAAIVNDFSHVELSPGLDQIEYERLGAEGRQQIHVLRVELADSNLYVDYIGNDAVTDPGTVTEFVADAGAIAGINGDFFDINNSSAPLGAAISREHGIMKSPEQHRGAAAAFSSSGLGRVAEIFIEGSITTPDGDLPLLGINTLSGTASAVSVYNAHWGDHTRTRAIPAGTTGVEVIVGADGTVTRTAQEPGSEQLAAGEYALVTLPGAVGDALGALELGDEVEISYRLAPESADITAAVSGHPTSEPPMLEDGVIGEAVSPYMRERHPRTAVGFTEDGRTAFFVVADGRQASAAGFTLPELGQLMLDLGARDAINLDGGGSSQLNSRLPGDASSTVRNSPSDGYERRDANGLGIFLNTPGSGTATALDVRTALVSDDADRVFPGYTRALTSQAYDESGSAAESAQPGWTASSGAARVVASDDGAVVTGVAPGRVTVTASAGGAAGSQDIHVLGDLQRISASSGLLAFGDAGDVRTLTITGHDADGFQAPLEPADVEVLDVPGDLLAFTPTADGTFQVRALTAPGSATATLRVGEHVVRVPITVGLEDVVFADFADAASWTAAHDRAPGGSIGAAEGYDGAPGLRLTYDFTQSTATRGQYAVAPSGGVVLPGQPQKVTAWVYGDGNGAWPRLLVRQANGTSTNLDGPNITWTGWQKAEFPVPTGVSYPLTFQRVRLMETRAAASYSGEVRVSGLSVALAPDVEIPPSTLVTDPVVVRDGDTDAAPLRVAVMSDAQFVARNPDSDLVAGARRALREIVAADPDLLVINGDFVDEASPADFELARRILDEELAGVDFPWRYVPGNHEIMGGAIDNFIAEFGDNYGSLTLDDTLFVTLDTSTGAVSGKHAQLELLHESLAAAEADPAVTGVVVLQHHPIDDPLPAKASQLSNRLDAALLRDWFETFRESSGKSIAFVGSHVGVFHATTEDGIPYLINGNSGKAPAGSEFGDFTGWTMLGIDPAEGLWSGSDEPWLVSEVAVRVDALRMADEHTLLPGATASLAPVVDQPGRSGVEVAWPMSYRWEGTDGVHVGSADAAPRGTVVSIDPETQVATAIGEGSATATLTVNGVSESVLFEVGEATIAVTGDAVQGSTVGVKTGPWPFPDDAQVSYAWLRDGVEIDGATEAEFDVTAADAGARLSVRATVLVEGAEPVVVTSAPTASVPFLALTPVTPLVTGTAQVGSTVTAVPGRWKPADTALQYQWELDGVPVEGATSSTFELLAEHEGAEITVTVSGSLAGHAPLSRTSAPLGPVTAAPVGPVTPQELSISAGSVVQGGSVTVSGRGFTRGATIEVWLHSDPVLLGSVTVTDAGTFAGTVTIPASTPAGAHRIVVTDPTTGAPSAAALTVTAAASSGTDGLAAAGGVIAWGLVAAALLALALGAVLVMRRRRASEEHAA